VLLRLRLKFERNQHVSECLKAIRSFEYHECMCLINLNWSTLYLFLLRHTPGPQAADYNSVTVAEVLKSAVLVSWGHRVQSELSE